jgi:hypothetical protein
MKRVNTADTRARTEITSRPLCLLEYATHNMGNIPTNVDLDTSVSPNTQAVPQTHI